ncbi:MAG TPA: hypothetical protein VGL82_11490 [Bryobacteraceae bacterium]|jgi:hypothetical protein
MSRNRYLTLCVLVSAGAFAGGYAANRSIPVAHAQAQTAPANLRATSFTLVNSQGQVQATLRSGNSGADLTLNDTNGNPRVEINPSSGIVIRDATGHVTWSSPKAGLLPATVE